MVGCSRPESEIPQMGLGKPTQFGSGNETEPSPLSRGPTGGGPLNAMTLEARAKVASLDIMLVEIIVISIIWSKKKYGLHVEPRGRRPH